MDYVFGVDIGGTNTKVGIVSREGEVISHTKFPTTAASDFEGFINLLKKTCDELQSQHPDKVAKALGLGAPNVNPQTGYFINASNLKWGDINLLGELKKYFDFPIHIENDANIAAVGEKVFGGAKDLDNFVVITLGTGLGSGAFVHGKLLRSFNSMAAEAGHLTIDSKGRPCTCGGRGHLESYVSVKGLKTTCHEVLEKDLKFSEILERFQAGDNQMVDLINQTADYLALGLSQIQAMLLPSKFILSGGVSNLGEDFRKWTEDYLNERYAFSTFRGMSEVELTTISLHDGAILGAAAICFYNS